jgi:hypothetical protein
MQVENVYKQLVLIVGESNPASMSVKGWTTLICCGPPAVMIGMGAVGSPHDHSGSPSHARDEVGAAIIDPSSSQFVRRAARETSTRKQQEAHHGKAEFLGCGPSQSPRPGIAPRSAGAADVPTGHLQSAVMRTTLCK